MNGRTAAVIPMPVAAGKSAPVKVSLRRVTCDYGVPYPPDGQGREWWQRLKKALGTDSSDFVEASLHQLVAAARLPGNGGISEISVNASLALIEAVKPRDEIESGLAIQMACCHSAAMSVLKRLGSANGSERNVSAIASAASRLMRAYSMQVETLRRLRSGGAQIIRIEHIHVNEGGQAIVGSIAVDRTVSNLAVAPGSENSRIPATAK